MERAVPENQLVDMSKSEVALNGVSEAENKAQRLERYIRESRRTQWQLKILCAVALAISGIIWFVDAWAGFVGVLITGFVAFIGFYITAMHIAEWEQLLYDMEQQE